MSWACLGLVWACLGSVLGLSWACLGLSSVYLGLSWAFLGLSWPALACLGPVLSCGAPVFKHFSTLCCPELLQHVFGALFFLRARFLSLYPAVLEPTHFYTHDAWIAAGNSCWFSLADFRSSPAARRYVRSTWNWLKIEKNLVWVWSGCGLQSLLKLNILKNCVLEASRLDCKGPGPRFWRVSGQGQLFHP